VPAGLPPGVRPRGTVAVGRPGCVRRGRFLLSHSRNSTMVHQFRFANNPAKRREVWTGSENRPETLPLVVSPVSGKAANMITRRVASFQRACFSSGASLPGASHDRSMTGPRCSRHRGSPRASPAPGRLAGQGARSNLRSTCRYLNPPAWLTDNQHSRAVCALSACQPVGTSARETGQWKIGADRFIHRHGRLQPSRLRNHRQATRGGRSCVGRPASWRIPRRSCCFFTPSRPARPTAVR